MNPNEAKNYYVYSYADCNADGEFTGLTLSEAKERAQHYCNELKRIGESDLRVVVLERGSGHYIWSAQE